MVPMRQRLLAAQLHVAQLVDPETVGLVLLIVEGVDLVSGQLVVCIEIVAA